MTSSHATTPLHQLDAWQAASLLARRELRAVDLVRACLDRIAEREPQLQAFVQLGADAALATARELDAGPVRGLLHGLPFGVKDLFDTCDLPTAYGSPIYAGQQPLADAAAVALCREAGAVLLGKTVTTELANMFPGVTRNPHHIEHTPGGSSSGSAAAVADAMLPLALGTQTAGSLIRPAAFCGVVGYKPSHNRVPRAGVKSLSETLDTVGGFARSVRDVALLGAVLTGDTRLADPAAFAQTAAPRIGFCRTPEWAQADEDTQQAWALAEAALAGHGATLALPPGLAGLVAVQKEVQAFETARSLSDERLRHRDQLSTPLQALIAAGLAIGGDTHVHNLRVTAQARHQVQDLFGSHDVLLAPSSIGEAPAGLDGTGDPLFCRTWTLLGLPCVHLPVARGRRGLPVGLQLVGAPGDDHRLLVAAHWVHARLSR
ncbi:amidase [Polaromonas sp.]|jgi:Asp-tRNA(Asn)/Glu-tRNA(Gln) amidotransferase A subunit family amidase|uniref:amidase n=1 Tax=Polaromonas sp. TaxID=1869339 RepID=UPI0037C6AC2B